MVSRTTVVFFAASMYGVFSMDGASAWADETPPSSGASSLPAEGTRDAGPPAEGPPAAGHPSRVPVDQKVDPQGITGISPYRQMINQADGEVLAGSLDEAEGRYRQAVASAPQQPLGYLRLAELAQKREKWAEAEEPLRAALRFSTNDPQAARQARFLLAQTLERLDRWDEATAAWNEYLELADGGEPPATPSPPKTTAAESAANASSNPYDKAVTRPVAKAAPRIPTETATARLEVIQARKKQVADSAAVKARIAKNLDSATQPGTEATK